METQQIKYTWKMLGQTRKITWFSSVVLWHTIVPTLQCITDNLQVQTEAEACVGNQLRNHRIYAWTYMLVKL